MNHAIFGFCWGWAIQETHSLAHVMGIPEVTDDPKYPHIIWKRLRGPYDRALTESQLRVVGENDASKDGSERCLNLCDVFHSKLEPLKTWWSEDVRFSFCDGNFSGAMLSFAGRWMFTVKLDGQCIHPNKTDNAESERSTWTHHEDLGNFCDFWNTARMLILARKLFVMHPMVKVHG